MQTDKVNEFRRRINIYASQLEMPIPQMEIDCVLPLSMINSRLVDDADIMQPFGAENPAPIIGIKNAVLKNVYRVGGGQHQRLTLECGNIDLSAMLFNVPTSQFAFVTGDVVDCALAVSRSSFRSDANGVSAIIRDIRLSSVDVDAVINADRVFECILRGESITPEQAESFLPEREVFEDFYRFFRHVGFRGTLDLLSRRLADKHITYEKMRTALCAMTQCGLLDCTVRSGVYSINVNKVSRKVNLEDSLIMKKLRQYQSLRQWG